MKRIVIFVLVIMIFLTAVSGYLFSVNFSEAADIYAANQANSLLNYKINMAVNNKLKAEGVEYDDFVEIEKDSAGKISYMRIDTVKLNMLSNEMTMVILDCINSIEKGEFGIPLGNAMGSRLFSGMGPVIKIKILPLGTIASDTRSVFRSAGINQTLHKIVIDFKVCVSLLTPFYSASSEINTSLNIAETIIVGEVPNIVWGDGNN